MDLNSFIQLIKDPFFNFILAIILFLLGNLVSYILFRIQVQPKRIFWDTKVVKSHHLSSSVTINRVIIWNGGLDSITSDDIAKTNPLAIRGMDKDALIRLRVLARNNSNASEIIISFMEASHPQRWRVDFEYFKRNQGIVLEIHHRHTSRTGEVEVSGDLIAGQIEHKSIEDLSTKDVFNDIFPISLLWVFAKPRLRRKIKAIVLSTITMFLLFYLLRFVPLLMKGYESIEQLPLILILMLFEYFIGFASYIFFTWQIWSTPQVPRGLEIYYDEKK